MPIEYQCMKMLFFSMFSSISTNLHFKKKSETGNNCKLSCIFTNNYVKEFQQ